MKRVLYDTNVILDVLLQREPHFTASAKALDAAGQKKVEGFISGHAVATIAYLLQRQVGRDGTKSLLLHLLSNLKVAPVTDAGIRQALTGAFADLEDAICTAAAQEAGAAIIITRNVADFKSSPIPAVTPAAFRWR